MDEVTGRPPWPRRPGRPRWMGRPRRSGRPGGCGRETRPRSTSDALGCAACARARETSSSYPRRARRSLGRTRGLNRHQRADRQAARGHRHHRSRPGPLAAHAAPSRDRVQRTPRTAASRHSQPTSPSRRSRIETATAGSPPPTEWPRPHTRRRAGPRAPRRAAPPPPPVLVRAAARPASRAPRRAGQRRLGPIRPPTKRSVRALLASDRRLRLTEPPQRVTEAEQRLGRLLLRERRLEPLPGSGPVPRLQGLLRPSEKAHRVELGLHGAIVNRCGRVPVDCSAG